MKNVFDFGKSFKYGYDAEPVDTNAILITPKYPTFKRELTNNSISVIGIKVFDKEYEKAQKKKAETHCRINYSAELSVQHLLALMIYCNFDTLSHKFSKTYRLSDCNSHSEFYHLGRYLKESVDKYGTKVSDGKVKVFYHGISEKVELPQYDGAISIYIPLSTSSSKDAAGHFTNDNAGMILELVATPNSNIKYFSMQWISDYKHEAEYLFIQNSGTFLIKDIFNGFDWCSTTRHRMVTDGTNIINNTLNTKCRPNSSGYDVFYFGNDWPHNIEPKHNNLKQEMLQNTYCIACTEWNGVFKKCRRILHGNFTSKKKQKWYELLRMNNIGFKHLVSLALYTDCDAMQKEFRKCFRSPYNVKERLEQFYHWRQILRQTLKEFGEISSKLKQPKKLFHGVKSIMCIDQFKGIYYGPCSTTTDLNIARSFAGKNGMILVMNPGVNGHKVLDISWISDYPDEREYLLFDHKIEIKAWILSSDYDQYYHYYHNVMDTNSQPSLHQTLWRIPQYLHTLKMWIEETDINYDKLEIEGVGHQEKIDLLLWIFKFALHYKQSKSPSKYHQSLNANIQHVVMRTDIMQLLPSMLIADVMKQLEKKQTKENVNMEISIRSVTSILNEHFIKC